MCVQMVRNIYGVLILLGKHVDQQLNYTLTVNAVLQFWLL